MACRGGESTSADSHNMSNSESSTNNNDTGSFECNICFELAQDPIVTLCGHLYCWPCLYEWLHGHAHASECPVCKAVIEENKLVPLYGRGKTPTDPRSKSNPGLNIPRRPTGSQPATAPRPDPNHFPQANPWLMGGTPLGSARVGNFTISAAIGSLLPLLNFQVHGFPDSTAFGPAPGFHYGYPHSFHGAHAHGYPRQVDPGQQADVYLKALLIMSLPLMGYTRAKFLESEPVSKYRSRFHNMAIRGAISKSRVSLRLIKSTPLSTPSSTPSPTTPSPASEPTKGPTKELTLEPTRHSTLDTFALPRHSKTSLRVLLLYLEWRKYMYKMIL